MKGRYFVHLAFRGTRFSGWQRQQNGTGVQEIVEDAIYRVWKTPALLHACGRTDAGVHADHFYCHLDSEVEPPTNLQFRLNQLLPGDISIREVIKMHAAANAQHDVTSRTYGYRIHRQKDPRSQFYSYWLPGLRLEMDRMEKVAEKLNGIHDFAGFCLQPEKHKSTICDMHEVKIREVEDRIEWYFKANRFLKGMVRLLVQRLIHVGDETISGQDFLQILRGGCDDFPHRKRISPEGLTLVNIEYPYAVTSPH